MPVTVVGVSLQPETLEQLDALAESDGVARSAMIARLVEQERRRRRGPKADDGHEVVVDGVRYAPARRRSRAA